MNHDDKKLFSEFFYFGNETNINEKDVKKFIDIFFSGINRKTVEEIQSLKNELNNAFLLEDFFATLLEFEFVGNEDKEIIEKMFNFYEDNKSYYEDYLKFSENSYYFEHYLKLKNLNKNNKIEDVLAKTELITFNLFHQILLFLFGKIKKIFVFDNSLNVFIKFFPDDIGTKFYLDNLKKIIHQYNNVLFVKMESFNTLTIEMLNVFTNLKHNQRILKYFYVEKIKLENGWPVIDELFLNYIEEKNFTPTILGLLEKLKNDNLISEDKTVEAFRSRVFHSPYKKDIAKILKNKKYQNKIKK